MVPVTDGWKSGARSREISATQRVANLGPNLGLKCLRKVLVQRFLQVRFKYATYRSIIFLVNIAFRISVHTFGIFEFVRRSNLAGTVRRSNLAGTVRPGHLAGTVRRSNLAGTVRRSNLARTVRRGII